MIELLVAFFTGATLTAVFGAPIAARLAQPKRLHRPAVAGHKHTNQAPTPVVRPFTPLDLGPDLMTWPSQTPWALSGRLEPDWPSKQWDDEHFGAHWRRQGHAGKVAAAAAAAESPAPPAQASKRQPAQNRRQKAAAAPAAPAPAAAPWPPAPQAAKGKPAAAATPAAVAKATPKGPPSDAEIEHLIATEGLAGTVQVIMARTGWEFRDAAQYLAQLRKGR